MFVFIVSRSPTKYLKGYLVFLDISFIKTHEIGELITKCENKDKEISIFKEEADSLTDYAISVRYPEEPLEPTRYEAKGAYEIAKKIKGFVLDKII